MANKQKVDKEEAILLRKLGWSCSDIAKYFESSEGYIRNNFGSIKKDYKYMLERYLR